MILDGWAYCDGCVVCPRCNAWVTCEPLVTEMLAVIPQHECDA